jgi:SAM-dependent methyltransferase
MGTRYVFAADTLIRFKGGRVLIQTSTSNLAAYETDSPMLIGWLCQFAKPLDIDAALATLQPADRLEVAKVIEYLKGNGALVRLDDNSAGTAPSEQMAARSKGHLRLLARSVYDLACDLLGFGAYAETELGKRGVGVERRLMAMLAAADAFRADLAELKAPYLRTQLQSMGASATSSELKLHIGCGAGLLEDWINIDISPAPLSMNILWGLPFKDGSARYVFVSHLLEHLFFPRDVRPFLAEVRRVLAPGGVVRVVVPDIQQCIEAYEKQDAVFFASRRETWSWWPENPTRLEDFLGYAGAGAEPAYLFESHKYGYDSETLARILAEAGFDGITRSAFMASEHPPLRVDEISAVAQAQYGDRYYSLFVEARA